MESSLPRAERLSRTAGYFAAFVALGLAGASLGPTLPGLAENTRALLSEISYLFTGRSLGYLVGSFLGGRAYDRTPGHRLMGTMLIFVAAMLALLPVVPWLWLLVTAVLLLGMAEGVLDVGGNTLLVWTHGRHVGPFMNGLHFFFGVGAFLSPVIVAQTRFITGDIRGPYWVLAVLILPVAGWMLRLPSTPPRVAAREPMLGAPPRREKQPISSANLLVALIAAFFFLYAGAEIGFGGWVFTYAVRSGLSGETTAAYLTSAFWGALTLGRLLAIPIAARLRPRYILATDLAGCFASTALILARPGSLSVLWLGALGLGFSMASIFPTTLSLAERRLTITGRVTGWFFVGASSGGMTWPWIMGQLFELSGPRAMMYAVFTALILATGLFTVLISVSGRGLKTVTQGNAAERELEAMPDVQAGGDRLSG